MAIYAALDANDPRWQPPHTERLPLNGVIINDFSNAGPGNVLGANMGVDAIQEFSVLTTNYSAEYGFTSGGYINAVMKSGTNQYHGDVYDSCVTVPSTPLTISRILTALLRALSDATSSALPVAVPSGKIRFSFSAIMRDSDNHRPCRKPPTFSRLTPVWESLTTIMAIRLPALTGACPIPNATNLAPGRAAVCVDNTMAKLINALDRTPTAGRAVARPSQQPANLLVRRQQVVSDNFGTLAPTGTCQQKDRLSFSWYRDHSTWSKPDG